MKADFLAVLIIIVIMTIIVLPDENDKSDDREILIEKRFVVAPHRIYRVYKFEDGTCKMAIENSKKMNKVICPTQR